MLFIHPSAVMSSPQFIVMPVGVISILNALRDYTVKAVDVGLELCLNKTFDITSFLKEYDVNTVGIDLHWHEHAFCALEIARLCKEVNPHCSVILGGFTASYFAEEILHFCKEVDVIVSGEAEAAVPLLLQGKNLSLVPNLVYRQNGHIKKTGVTPVSLQGLDFSRCTNIHHWEEYLKCSIHGYTKTQFWQNFWLCTGRGCIYECSYCGGACSAQKNLCNREGITFRPVDAVIADLQYLQDIGVHVVSPSHDIFLAGKKYWESLFEKMKKEGIYMGMYLEVWQLPDKDFIEGLASACDPRFTTLVITLLSGSESVREKNGKHFTNAQYYTCVNHIEDNNINHVPYFATGLPFETQKTFEKTLTMTEKIRSDFHPCAIFCTPLRLDPGSPMFEHPDDYNIVKHFHTFTDYYTKCKNRSENLPFDPTGYHTHLDGETIMTMQHQWESLMQNNPVVSGASMDTLHFV